MRLASFAERTEASSSAIEDVPNFITFEIMDQGRLRLNEKAMASWFQPRTRDQRLFFADFSQGVFVEDIGTDAIEFGRIVELNAHIVVNRADGDGVFHEKIFGFP